MLGSVEKRQPIDIVIGARVRHCREARKLDAETLARSLNIPTSRLEEFESGVLRLSALNLFELAKALDVPVNYFFRSLTQPTRLSLVENQYCDSTEECKVG